MARPAGLCLRDRVEGTAQPVSLLRSRAAHARFVSARTRDPIASRSKISCQKLTFRNNSQTNSREFVSIVIAEDFVVSSAVTKVFLLVFYRTMKPECFFWMNNSSHIVCFDESVLVMWLPGYRSILCLCDGLFCDGEHHVAMMSLDADMAALLSDLRWVYDDDLFTLSLQNGKCYIPLAMPMTSRTVPLWWVLTYSPSMFTYLPTELMFTQKSCCLWRFILFASKILLVHIVFITLENYKFPTV